MLSTEKKVITLPSAEEMKKRLDMAEMVPYDTEQFHLLLLESAGREVNPNGVVMILMLAVNNFTNDSSPIMGGVMRDSLPDYIDILIDDESVREAAKSYLREAL